MGPVVVQEMCPTQCEIRVGKRRVGYVCYGERMPINFLSKATSGVELTERELTEVAKETRSQMAKLNAERERASSELSTLISSDYEYGNVDEGTDPTGTDETPNADSSGS